MGRVIDRTPAANCLRWLACRGSKVAADFSGETCERVAHSQRGEHHRVVLVRAGRRDAVALADVALATAAAILVGAEDALQIVLGLCTWSKGR